MAKPTTTTCADPGCCAPQLGERAPLSFEQAGDLEALFKVLANDTRLRLLHALVRGAEVRVGDLCDELEMRPQAISNQLQRLADQRIVSSRRDGVNIHYRIVNPCVTALLDLALCMLEGTLPAAQADTSGRGPSK